ncbi:MAG TPA: 50S ribosomal protein L4 [Candidatus Wolfebacteria bacterium]|nr:50S ribosomal protein L4 [Candidatus Wolfebacteria bacterium]
MNVDVFDKQNNKVGKVELPDRIFAIKWNADLVHHALQAQIANSRQNLAHAKTRAEIRGGGRKPWRQKGTGRARHGSIRSPIWIGGGATHGPLKEKIFEKKVNKKMRRLAIFSALSKKLKDGELKVIDSLKLTDFKTKELFQVLKSVLSSQPNVILISSLDTKNIHQAISNIKKVDAISSRSLNVYDLLKYKNIILEKDAIKEIEEHYKGLGINFGAKGEQNL